jgi:hypothetical protein
MGHRSRAWRQAVVVVLVTLAGLAWPLEAPVARPRATTDGDCPPVGARDAAGRYYPATSDCPSSAPAAAPPEGGGKKHKDSSLLPLLLFGTAVAVAGAAAADKGSSPSAPREPTPDELLQNGPLVFLANPIGTFSAYGFVQNGAPIVVDVQTYPDTKTQLSVTVGKRTSSMTIDPGGEPLVILYQGGGAAEPQVALFRLTSTRLSEKGKEKPAPIRVVGVGAGRRAMGSVAINDVSFGPAQMRAGADQATLRYVTESPFDRLATDVLRYRPGAKDTIVVERVWRRTYGQLDARAYVGEPWNGRLDRSSTVSGGVHLLQVTGWELTGDRAWVAAYSPRTVEVQ